MRYLLDTNVVSEIAKPHCNAGVASWWASIDADLVHLSVITLGEIRRGVELVRLRSPERAAVHDVWLEGLSETFRGRIESIEIDVALEWGRVRTAQRTPPIDSLLAATALVRGWTLVTRNVRDVEKTGCLVLNPFT